MAISLIKGDDDSNTLQGGTGDDVIYGFDPDGPQSQVSTIAATLVATGLDHPLFVGASPDDLDRLFIVQKTGTIKILDLHTGQVLATPFLDVSAQTDTTGERGLLGVAFHPNFASNGLFYVNLINKAGDTEIRSYHVSATDPNRADLASEQLVITIDQPATFNHKAGWLDFGADGYLYASLGDGGASSNAQLENSLLGKILRLDVDTDAFPGDPLRNYGIPADNPFTSSAPADEIYAMGLRNPWRPSFDRALHTLYIADVGQTTWEEVNVGAPGANYGWPLYEGSDGSGAIAAGTLTFPIYSYNHLGGGASITGGYVYRGESEGLQGDYFFADFVKETVSTLHFNGASWIATDRTAQIVPDAGVIDNPSSFGEDGRGNLYVVDINGEVFRLDPVVNSLDQADSLRGDAGDDRIFGGSGNDVVQGGPGDDILYGGPGNDTMHGGPDRDVLFGGTGNDVLIGAEDDDVLVGDAGIDYLIGGPGDDILDDRDSSGNQLQGGIGNDTYKIASVADTLVEFANEGTDEVQTGLGTYFLRDNVENLTYAGTGGFYGKGTGADNVIRGGIGNDLLVGQAGNDTLIGRGGSDYLIGYEGNDTLDATGGTGGQLQGGTGNDTYIVDNYRDSLVEFTGEGTDEVRTTLAAYSLRENLENLTYTGAAGFSGTGNALVNVIRGGGGADTLDGAAGTDQLYGGGGDDVLVFDIADTHVDGGGGSNTLRFTGSGQALDLAFTAADQFVGIEIVDLAGTGDNTLTLTASELLALSPTGTLQVDGNSGDAVFVTDPVWSSGADRPIGANTYHAYTKGGATLLIDGDVSQVVPTI